jgi:hypothetical protein
MYQDHKLAQNAEHHMKHMQAAAARKSFDDQMKAAVKIQAVHRGNKAREIYYKKHHCKEDTWRRSQEGFKVKEQHAATKIQAAMRGKKSRDNGQPR